MAIITLNDFTDYIGTTDINEQRATDIINAINAWAEDYTGRIWGEIVEMTDIFDYEPVVFLTHLDIQEIVSVKVFGTEISNYKCNKETGRVLVSKQAERNKYKYDDFDGIEITYKAGKTDVPSDVKTALLQLVAEDYNKRDDKDGNIASESLGGYSVSYGNSSSNSTSSTQNGKNYRSAIEILNRYRLVRL